jgi:hypothetical protein
MANAGITKRVGFISSILFCGVWSGRHHIRPEGSGGVNPTFNALCLYQPCPMRQVAQNFASAERAGRQVLPARYTKAHLQQRRLGIISVRHHFEFAFVGISIALWDSECRPDDWSALCASPVVIRNALSQMRAAFAELLDTAVVLS